MVRVILFTVFLTQLICFNQTLASEKRNFAYLKAPMVQWSGNRLTGEFKQVPVSGLLEDLIKSENVDCDVTGNLPGAISIRFENLTPEEVIHKIMLNNNYNYTLVSGSESASTDDRHSIGKLTIYQGDEIVTFSSVPKRSRMPQATNKMAHAKPTASLKKMGTRQTTLSPGQHKEDIEKLHREYKGFLDSLLESKKISKEEYEKALADMNAKENIK